MVAYTLGNLVGPFCMLDVEYPIYRSGMIVFVAGNFAVVLCTCIMLFMMKRINTRRIKNRKDGQKTDAHLDLTDKQDPNFIYKL
jgi:ACS family allantoate permease-like MFS transporter